MQPLASRMAVMTGEGALAVNARARGLERQGRSIIHLELGEPDFHPAPPVNDALSAPSTMVKTVTAPSLV